MNCSTNNRCRTSVFEDLNRGLNQIMRGVAGRELITSDNPRLSLSEFDNRYIVECDVPGMSIENVTLQLEDYILTISGKRALAVSDDDTKVLLNERTATEFNRRLQLSRDIDHNSVDAEMSAGVLRITVAKRAEVLPRKIAIRRNVAHNA